MPRGIEAKSVSEINFVNNCEEYESIVGWAYQPNNEIELLSAAEARKEFSLLGRADCSLRAEEAHGGVEPAEHSVDPLIANNQAELERGVGSSFCNYENTPLSRISNAHKSSQRTATSSLGEVASQDDDNLLTETDQVSKPLGVFASKSVSCRHSNADLHKKVAFTLAEVLITLGIIGVVAALTLPSVINKYRSFVLEQQFKKSYSNLSQTIINMKRDSGLEYLRDNYVHYAPNSGYDSTLVRAFYDSFDSHIAPVDKLKKIYPVTNYSGTGTSATDYGGDWPKAIFILKDGSSVGRQVNNGCLLFWIDSNGPYKKPNRYGFDIFELRVCDSTDALKPVKAYKNNYTDEELEKEEFPDIAGAPCTKKSKQLLNGIGCSWYALNNINPDDNSKKYWDSLPW